MKIFTRHMVGLLFFCLFGSTMLQAQEKSTLDQERREALRQTKEYAFMQGAIKSDRPLIGIYTGHASEGIGISSVVEGGGAAAAGLEAGDVITAINGNRLEQLHDLQIELSKYEGDQTVAVEYIRDGQARQAQVTLKAKPHIRSDRPLIGIYPESNAGQGIRVDDITAGGGAVEAGIRSGDVITHINDALINSTTDLMAELSKYESGQSVAVAYTRDGQTRQAQVVLKERKTTTNWTQERNPCDVFIGVSLGGSGDNGRGVHVSNIIDDTPAKVSDVRGGDVIMAFDDVSVNTFNELLHERNKHQPGDYFTLTIMREGRQMDIEAQFKTCDEETPVEKEEEEIIQEDKKSGYEPVILDNSLKVEQWKAFPNPAFGNLSVQFEAEALPTTVRLVDVNGKAVFQETINRFDGYYNQQIDLKDVTPGNYFLQVRQGERVVTEKIVVMPRA
ncbi:MAG: PDZ domain-containing protein [Saprospiraceae bacterium]|nr:PDZ domain-containing protein [Lewinella sp.]